MGRWRISAHQYSVVFSFEGSLVSAHVHPPFALQMLMVQSVVADINRRTGESECQYYKDRLLYSEDGQRDELIARSRTLSCHGELKNNRGLVSTFLQPRNTFIILFDSCGVLSPRIQTSHIVV